MPPTQETKVHRSRPRPRLPKTGGPHDPEVTRHRAIAALIILVVLIVVLLGVRGCRDAANDRALRDYTNNVSSMIAASQESGRTFFGQLENPGDAVASEIEAGINAQRLQAAQQVRSAARLDVPSDMRLANRYLIDVLEFRRDGFGKIGELIGPALSDDGADEAIDKIANQMAGFLASDVIYSQRVYPAMVSALRDNGLDANRVPQSNIHFLQSIDWLDPTKVADVLGRARGVSGSKAVAPGLHGSGIVEVKALPSGTALTDGAAVSLAGAASLEVKIQNQGENDEKNVVTTVTIGEGAGAIRLKDTIGALAAGESATAAIPLTKTPAGGGEVQVTIEVKRVPGEKNVENNKIVFNATFGG